LADDTITNLVIKSNSDALTLQRDLDKLAQWKQLWEMAFHPDKSSGALPSWSCPWIGWQGKIYWSYHQWGPQMGKQHQQHMW